MLDFPKKQKHTINVYFICIFTLLYLFVLLLVVRQIILIFFIFIWLYSFSKNIPNCTETVILKPWYKPSPKKVEPSHPYWRL